MELLDHIRIYTSVMAIYTKIKIIISYTPTCTTVHKYHMTPVNKPLELPTLFFIVVMKVSLSASKFSLFDIHWLLIVPET